MAKPKKQIAALPLRVSRRGKVRVMLVTSRETKRWVMPKGWPMDGKKPWRAAEIEAMEEAGLIGKMSRDAIGTYDYKKKMASGKNVRCRVRLYPMHVKRLKKHWPERGERRRKWFSPKRASKLVKEPELSNILEELGKSHNNEQAIQNLFD